MTKKERQKLIGAINLFLDDNPDRWVDGIDALCLLVYGRKWSDHVHNGKPVSIRDLLSSNHSIQATPASEEVGTTEARQARAAS